MAVFTAIGASVATATGIAWLGTLTAAALQVAAGIGVSLIAKALAGDGQKNKFGVQVRLQGGDDVPRSILFGYNCTAGSLVYGNAWGQVGNTPNGFITQVIALADYPIQSLQGVEVNGSPVTLLTPVHPNYGSPVSEFRKDGVDHLWVKFYDGTQTVADPFLVSTVSSTERPYTSNRVGLGIPYAIVTARAHERKDDEEEPLFSGGFPQLKFVTHGAKLYDITKDSTAGGSGTHRIDNPATWGGDGDFLPAVQIYAILSGIIKYNSQWLYGLQSLPLARLPNANWIAAVNACRQSIGGFIISEPSYRSGGEIQVGAQLKFSIEAMLTACQGRLTEVGGVYKLYVGQNNTPSFSITDGDIISTEGQTFTPFFALEDTINGIQAKYPNPEESWNTKTAPPLIRTDLEALDGNRRLMADVTLDMVPYSAQVQRLMKFALAEAQRARRHTITVGPELWPLEPGDVIQWTSARNGYVNKLFRVDGISDKSNLDILLDITEIDPSDYNWNPNTDLNPIINGPLQLIGSPPLPMIGWQVYATSIQDETNRDRRPAIEVWYQSGIQDVDRVKIQVRVLGQTNIFFSGEIPYGSPWRTILGADFPPDTEFEVRGIFVRSSGGQSQWSSWLYVKTLSVKLQAYDFDPYLEGQLETIGQWIEDDLAFLVSQNTSNITQEILDRQAEIAAERAERLLDTSSLGASYRFLFETQRRTALQLSDVILSEKRNLVLVREELTFGDESSRAFALDQINLAVGPSSALAERLTTIEAQAETNYADLSGNISTVESVLVDALNDESSARQALQIQLVGNYSGNDLNSVTEGLLFQERQTRISEDEALSTAIDLVAASSGSASLFDWIMQWSWENTLLGWTGNGSPTVSNGWLRPANQASEPYIISPDDLSLNSALYKQIRFYIRKTGNPTWDGFLWWQTDSDTTWDVARRTSITEPSVYLDGNQSPVTVNVNWSGTIKRIRLELSTSQTGSDFFELSYLYIGRPSPGASQAQVATVQQALTTQILAEASSRENLSVILTGLSDPSGSTLPTLTSGLIYDERVARVSGDEANSTLITGIASQINDPTTGLDALAQAQQTLSTTVQNHGDQLTIQSESINDILTELDVLEETKASVGITDSLQAQINDFGGTEGLRVLGESNRSIRLTVDRLALVTSDLILTGKSDKLEVSGIIANVDQILTSKIDVTNEGIVVLGEIVDSINLAIMGYDGPNAIANAVSSLTSSINVVDGKANANSDSITALDVSVGRFSASGRFRVGVAATEAGAQSTIGLSTSATDGGATVSASLFLSALAGGTSRVNIVADNFVVSSPAGPQNPLVYDGTALRLNVANIGTITAGLIQSGSGTSFWNLNTGAFRIST